MSKYRFELKLEIINRYKEGLGPVGLSKEFNVNKDTIKKWIRQYKIHGEEGLKKACPKLIILVNLSYPY